MSFVTPTLTGRLGNQIFEIATAMALALDNNAELLVPNVAGGSVCYFDHFPLFNPEIHKVEAKYNENNRHEYRKIQYRHNLQITGYFQSELYFKHRRKEVLEAFGFHWEPMKGIVALHVRRGDLVTHQKITPLVKMSFYDRAIKHFTDLGYQDFMIFSDDMKWCQDNFKQKVRFHYSGLSDAKDDMALQSCCQPTGTMIRTVNGDIPIEELKVGSMVISCYMGKSRTNCQLIGTKRVKGGGSGRKVSGISSRDFNGDLIVASTNLSKSKYTPDHHCVVKMGDAFLNKHCVYLMKKGDKFRVGVSSPTKYHQGRLNGASLNTSDPRRRMSTEKAESCWVIDTFDNLSDALIEESYISYKFGIPQTRFLCHLHKLHEQISIDLFWNKYGPNIENGIRCLEYYGRDYNFPFFTQSKERLIRFRISTIRACNLLNGMHVIDANLSDNGEISNCWIPISVSRERYSGKVFSMTVDINHTYIGDGILTHNCEHQIISNSTFSWWSAWLNQNPDKIVISPHKNLWFGAICRLNMNTVIPNEWIQLSY